MLFKYEGIAEMRPPVELSRKKEPSVTPNGSSHVHILIAMYH